MLTYYGKKEIERVLTRGHWESWDQVLQWLEHQGSADSELPLSAVRSMTEDFQRLKAGGELFSNDAESICKLVQWMRAITH